MDPMTFEQFKAFVKPATRKDPPVTTSPVTGVTDDALLEDETGNSLSPNNNVAVTGVTGVTGSLYTQGEKDEQNDKNIVLQKNRASMASMQNTGNTGNTGNEQERRHKGNLPLPPTGNGLRGPAPGCEHPTQTTEEMPDGSVLTRCAACRRIITAR